MSEAFKKYAIQQFRTALSSGRLANGRRRNASFGFAKILSIMEPLSVRSSVNSAVFGEHDITALRGDMVRIGADMRRAYSQAEALENTD